jgi:hypothetical protein
MNVALYSTRGKWITEQRMLVTIATAVPVWNFYGFAINFFPDTWDDAPIPVIPISYGLNACFVVLLPVLPRGRRTALGVAGLLGSLMAVWSAVGMAFSPAPKLIYTAVPTVLGAATTILAVRELRQQHRGHAVEPSDAPSFPPPPSRASSRR